MSILPKVLYISILILGVFSLVSPVLANHPCITNPPAIAPSDHLCRPNTATSIDIFFQQIAAFLIKYGMPFVVIFLVIAGFMFVTARGNEEQLTKAKVVLFWTIIGATIIIGANIIAAAIADFGGKLG